MDRMIIGPMKYIQGKNTFGKMAEYSKSLGTQFFAIADDFVTGLVGDSVRQSFEHQGVNFSLNKFNGECCNEEIERLVADARAENADVIIGIGGGKTIDTAKALAYELNLPSVIAPTVASSDAPTSSVSVVYTASGEYSHFIVSKNPSIVLMDSEIISKAPVRLLVAGMGDALATYFEARANLRSGKPNGLGCKPTKTSQAMAKLCFETLLEDGLKAIIAVENGCNSEAVENIIEANTYLSGIGFESGGIAAAHAIHNGFTILEETHHIMHGEKVAFGTLSQLALENAPMEEIRRVLEFCKSVGLPTTLHDLGLKEIDKETLFKVATAACHESETIHNMPMEVTPEAVVAAMLTIHNL